MDATDAKIIDMGNGAWRSGDNPRIRTTAALPLTARTVGIKHSGMTWAVFLHYMDLPPTVQSEWVGE